MDTQYEGKDLEALSVAKNYNRWIVSEFRAYLGGRTAEVGAGSGNVSSLLIEENTKEFVAIEPSPEMFALLNKKFHASPNVKCIHASFVDVSRQYADYFDSVLYINVLEHIEHDTEELLSVHKSLKRGGHVCIFVPALPWLYSEFDASIGHYRRYQKKQLEKMLQDAGFEVMKISFFDFLGIIPWFIVFKLFHKRKLSTGNTYLFDTIVVPVSRFFESLIPTPIGKNLVAVGRKK